MVWLRSALMVPALHPPLQGRAALLMPMRRRDQKADERRQRAELADKFRQELDTFVKRDVKDRPLSEVGVEAVGDPNFVFEVLAEARTPRPATIERFREYMAKHRKPPEPEPPPKPPRRRGRPPGSRNKLRER
jgi:hypothetical protein